MGNLKKQYAIQAMKPYIEAKLSLKQALFVILGITCCVFTLVVGVYAFQKFRREEKARLSRYSILGIVQKCSSQDMLKTEQLAELLGISSDVSQNLYGFDLAKATFRLKSLPCMKRVELKAVPPNLLSIDYELRAPKWLLADYENTAVDERGYIFPLSPFYSPKSLPEIVLGLPPFQMPKDLQGRDGGAWNKPLQGRHFDLVVELFECEKTFPPHFEIVTVDVQKTFQASKDSEIVLKLREKRFEEKGKVRLQEYLLRLPFESYRDALSRFFQHVGAFQTMRSTTKCQIVDLRLDRIALVKSIDPE